MSKKTHAASRLFGKMQAQIAFRHGRDGMMHHRGMTIDAVDSAAAFGKKIREEHVAPKMRRRDDDRNDAAIEKYPVRFRGRGRCCRSRGALSNVEHTLCRIDGRAEFLEERRMRPADFPTSTADRGCGFRRRYRGRGNPGKRARCFSSGTPKKRTVKIPFVARASRTSVEPVKSSP
jgi:hypothetical protein